MDLTSVLALSPIVFTVIAGIAIIIYFSKKAAPVELTSEKSGKMTQHEHVVLALEVPEHRWR